MATPATEEEVTKIPLLEALQQQAQEDEQNAYTKARLQYLESRVVALNVEVRLRDNEINNLRAQLDKHKDCDSAALQDAAEAV